MNSENRNSITLGDTTLSYFRCGQGKKILICLHHMYGSSLIFKNFIEKVGDDYKTYAIDMRSFGESDIGKTNISVKTLAIDILRFVKAKGFTFVSVLGYGLGAKVAFYMNKLEPSLVNKIVLVSPCIFAKGVKTTYFNLKRYKYKIMEPFQKVSKKINLSLSKQELLLNNIGVYEDDLQKMENQTLIITTENSRVLKSHTEMIVNSLKNATLSNVNPTTADIFEDETTINLILNFLNKKKQSAE